jgi:hypothetical protein
MNTKPQNKPTTSATCASDAKRTRALREMEQEAPTCPICYGPLEGRHCKLVCRNCGYHEDCSDLFPSR